MGGGGWLVVVGRRRCRHEKPQSSIKRWYLSEVVNAKRVGVLVKFSDIADVLVE